MHIPAQQVTLEKLKENFEKAFYTVRSEEHLLVITHPFDKLLISIERKDCIKIDNRYTIENVPFSKYQIALEKVNQANIEYLGLKLSIAHTQETLILSGCYYMFFNQELDMRQLVTNSEFVNRVTAEMIREHFIDFLN